MENREIHVRINADENGETETKELAVVKDEPPDGPHRLASFEVKLADDSPRKSNPSR